MQSLNELKIGESSANNNIQSEPVEETVNFFARFIAYLVDISIVYIPFFLLSSELDNYLAKAEIEIAYLRYYKMLVSELVWMVYTIYFYRKYCATPGKLLFQIQVIAEETKSRLSISRIILREI